MLRVHLVDRDDPGDAAVAGPVGSRGSFTRTSLSASVLAAVRYDGDGGRRRFVAALDHLGRLYAPLLPDGTVTGTWCEATSTGLAVVGGELGPDGACWGRPIGPGGHATGQELRAALARPALARELLGTWVLAGWTGEGLRLVSTADSVHSLARVEGSAATAWATRGLAAHALAGVRPILAEELIPEMVLFDFVLGDRELLAATRVEDAATVVDLERTGCQRRSYWPLGERLAPGPPTTPASLREVLGSVTRRLHGVPDAVLGLTAGQDSALLASSIHEQGGCIATLTMGDPSWPDVIGARAVADTLGWPHQVLTAPDPATVAGPSLESAVRWSAWTEGLDIGRDLIGPALADPVGSGRVFVTGLGGETGRAVYWHGPASTPPLDQLLTHRGFLPAAQHARLTARLDAALTAVAVEGRRGRSALDVFYLDQRVRKWQLRSRPVPWVDGTLGGFLGPAVARALLDLPEADQATGQGFLAAVDLGRPPLRDIVRDALPAPVPASRPSRRARLAGRLRPGAPPPPPPELRLIDALLGGIPGGPARTDAALGAGVLDGLRQRARHEPGARRQLWSVIAIEALDMALDQLDWPTR